MINLKNDTSAAKITSAAKVHQYKKKSQVKTIWMRLKRNRLAMVGLVLFLIMMR